MALVSCLAILASLILCFTQGLSLGIDFKGGTVMDVSVQGGSLDTGHIRNLLKTIGIGDVAVQTFGAHGDVEVKFQTPPHLDANQTSSLVMQTLIKAFAPAKLHFSNMAVVGPKVSGELFRSGLLALGVAIGLMLLFIWVRYQLQFGLGAVAALFHDVILTFGLFSLFHLEFTLTSIAAILTIIGYSMNDTVVVFDRLRENLHKFRKKSLKEVIDLSINETLSRTVITGLTALLALGGLVFFGGEALRSFAIALIFGISVGTYSSIYVASPIILLWGVKTKETQAKPLSKPLRDNKHIEKKPLKNSEFSAQKDMAEKAQAQKARSQKPKRRGR